MSAYTDSARLTWNLWKSLSEEQMNQLEAALEAQQCRDMLAAFLKLGPEAAADRSEAQEVLVDFHFYNYAFCKEQRFDARKSSTYMSIMHEVITEDLATDDAVSGVKASFERFKELVLQHSVERPPWSIGIFTLEDAAAITEYTVNSYFRHYHLYKHLYTVKVTTVLVQRNLHGTEEPFSVPPLADAVPVELDITASDSLVDTTTAAVAAASIEA
eukprot:18787-Heterococcus_DN1.PRE.2